MTGMRRLIAGLIVLSVVPAIAPMAAHAAEPGVYHPETAKLDNGMEVVVVTNRRVPAVTHMVWYKVGAADERSGQTGIAHFLEHLMFKGTDKTAPGEFSRLVARNGGEENAFTSYDYTAYYQTVARDRLEMVMRLEADRMTGLTLTDAVVDPERQVVWEERRQRYENTPDDRFSEQLRATAFVHHPYGTPVIGWPMDIKAMSRDAAETFYKTWYAPNNAILVVSGDVTMADVLPLAKKYYGVIPAKPVPARWRPAEPPMTAARRVSFSDPEIREPEWSRQWIAPSYGADPDQHADALQVLAEVMGGGSTSRLYKRLVVERKLATEAWLAYSPSSIDPTSLYVGGSPAQGVAMDDFEKAIEGEVAELLEKGVTEEEVATAKKRMLIRAAYALDGLSGPARGLGMALAIGRGVEDVENWPVRIDAVTPEQVLAAARAVMSNTNHVTGVLTPAAKSPSKPRQEG